MRSKVALTLDIEDKYRRFISMYITEMTSCFISGDEGLVYTDVVVQLLVGRWSAMQIKG